MPVDVRAAGSATRGAGRGPTRAGDDRGAARKSATAQLGKFVLRRDPRDLSWIWALDPKGGAYLEVPYRTASRPPISV